MLRRGPADTRLYRFVWALITRLFHVLFRMRVEGREHVPAEGAVVVASNHLSNIDPVFLGVTCPRQIHFMAKSELWGFRPLGALVQGLGAFPVRRGEADREAIRSAVSLLDARAVVGIFPEGHRQKQGKLGVAQPGVALLAAREGVKTVPAAITGTDRILRGGIPRLPRVTVTFGPPVDVAVEGLSRGERHTEIGRRIMASIGGMLGYADTVPQPDQEVGAADAVAPDAVAADPGGRAPAGHPEPS